MPVLPDIQVVKGSKEYRTILRPQNEHGPLYEVQIYGERLKCHFREGQTISAKIIWLYVPETKMFNWFFWESLSEINLEKFLNSQMIVLLNHKITCFSLTSFNLWVRESIERYNTYEEGYENFLNKLEKNLNLEIYQVDFLKWFRFVNLRKYLKRDFFVEQSNSLFDNPVNPTHVRKIARITHSDSKWYMELEGAEQQKATVILKDDYDNEEEPILLSDDYYKHRDIGSLIDDYEVLEVSGDCVIENPVKMWKKGSESIIHGAENYPKDYKFLPSDFR